MGSNVRACSQVQVQVAEVSTRTMIIIAAVCQVMTG